jgi:DNA-binding NarL/FixJ family response regulator
MEWCTVLEAHLCMKEQALRHRPRPFKQGGPKRPSSRAIRLVLADHHTLLRSGLRCLLEKIPTIRVIGEAATGREASDLARTGRAHVVLLDLTIPNGGGLEIVSRIVGNLPTVRVLVLSAHADPRYALQCFEAGAAGYLLKTAPVEELERAIVTAMRGESYVSPRLAQSLAPGHIESLKREMSAAARLTSRQREILQRLAEGRNAKEIALELQLSPKTVEFHRAQMMARLGIRNLVHLVQYAMRIGLVPWEATDAG